ncbi:MAG: hypothetical protein ABIJ09_10145 [Pseudomonadota bacterium]
MKPTATQTMALIAMLLGLLTSACPSAAIHRTARTLDPGQSELSATANVGFTRIASPASNGTLSTTSSLVLPGVVPVLSYHMGVIDGVEMGANISPLTLSLGLDTKVRVARLLDNHLLLAVQPGVDLQGLVMAWGASGTLPFIATYELNDMVSFTGYGYLKAGTLAVIGTGSDAMMNSVGGGVGSGIELRGDSFFVMPLVEINTTASFTGNSFNQYMRSDVLQVGISIGYHGDLLRIMNRKLDTIDAKVDHLEHKVDDRFDRIDRTLDGLGASDGAASSAPASQPVVDGPRL